jgi:hypothetical protein
MGLMAHYELGNCLRGYFSGEFDSDDEAWRVLSERFNRGFPSRSGRTIQMSKTIREGHTAGGNETERDRLLREKIEAQLLQRDRDEALALEAQGLAYRDGAGI